jgi:hypothetical protein
MSKSPKTGKQPLAGEYPKKHRIHALEKAYVIITTNCAGALRKRSKHAGRSVSIESTVAILMAKERLPTSRAN